MAEMQSKLRSPSAGPAMKEALALGEWDWSAAGAALALGVAYYAGAKVGLVLTSATSPVSVLWPPNALLFGALLLAPHRWWAWLIAAVFPAHLLAELQGGVPLPMVLGWFASNVSEAVIGASLARWLAGGRVRLNTVRSVAVFLTATVIASVLSSFLDAALVRLVGWVQADYWSLWRGRVFSNVLASITFTTVIVTWAAEHQYIQKLSRARQAEAAALVLLLVAASVAAFGVGWVPPEAGTGSLLYLPVPILVWAAVRFGPAMVSLSFAAIAFLSIWSAAQGHGPFYSALDPRDALPIQLFLISLAVPQMLLAAVIEERRQTERRLTDSRELFAKAFHASPDAIAISSAADGEIIEANDRWLALLQYERSAAAPVAIAPLASHLGDTDRDRLAALAREGREVRDVELVLRDCRGAPRNAIISMSPLRMYGLDWLLLVVRDITRQRQAEWDAREQRQQLAHLARVASLTDFSSTLAHELNQPLTAILSNAQAALRFMDHQPANLSEVRAILDEIVDADRRAVKLIHHLRLLMKKGEEAFVPLDLNTVVADVVDFVRGEFTLHKVEPVFSYGADLPPVSGDDVQLQQLVLNLVSNACDAMRAVDAPRRLSITTLRGYQGDVQLLVADTGPGIRAEHAERIFEPFYTTKESGLGLGLAICRKIALAHGGTLRAEAVQPRGTCFRLVLPRAS